MALLGGGAADLRRRHRPRPPAAGTADRRAMAGCAPHHYQRPLHRPGDRGRDLAGRTRPRIRGGRPGAGTRLRVRGLHRRRPGPGAHLRRRGTGPGHRGHHPGALPAGGYPHRIVRGLPLPRERLPPDHRQRPVREDRPARPGAQQRPTQHAQPLHHQVAGVDPPRRPGRGVDLPLHPRRRERRRPTRDARPRRPARGRAAALGRPPPVRRHRGGHRPGDLPGPPTRYTPRPRRLADQRPPPAAGRPQPLLGRPSRGRPRQATPRRARPARAHQPGRGPRPGPHRPARTDYPHRARPGRCPPEPDAPSRDPTRSARARGGRGGVTAATRSARDGGARLRRAPGAPR